jgi:hypothetical protein
MNASLMILTGWALDAGGEMNDLCCCVFWPSRTVACTLSLGRRFEVEIIHGENFIPQRAEAEGAK